MIQFIKIINTIYTPIFHIGKILLILNCFSSNLNRNITELVIDTFINLYHSRNGFVNITLIKVNIKNNKLHIVIQKKN